MKNKEANYMKEIKFKVWNNNNSFGGGKTERLKRRSLGLALITLSLLFGESEEN